MRKREKTNEMSALNLLWNLRYEVRITVNVAFLHLRILQLLAASLPHLQIVDSANLLQQRPHFLILWTAAAAGRRDSKVRRESRWRLCLRLELYWLRYRRWWCSELPAT